MVTNMCSVKKFAFRDRMNCTFSRGGAKSISCMFYMLVNSVVAVMLVTTPACHTTKNYIQNNNNNSPYLNRFNYVVDGLYIANKKIAQN